MYIPPQYQLKDLPKAIEFIQQFPFGLLITSTDNTPIATHLPFIIEQQESKWYLIGHMAKANPQWALLETCRPLIVFQEPHAYISPTYYEKEENVPTWNYISVHLYGKATVFADDDNKALEVLEKTIAVFEKNYQNQWQNLRQEYKQRLLKGMVAFQIEIDEWQAKEKLSQNKTQNEQKTIAEGLMNSNDSAAKQLGEIMNDRLC